MIKTGLLAGGRLWELVRGWEPGRGTPERRLELIRRCAAYKARIVADDPTEQGVRAVLNLGHSIGHAIEAAAGYTGIGHGEAVAVGLLPALWLSSRLCGLDPAVEDEVRELLVRHGLPTSHAGVDPAEVRAALGRDKKARAGRVRFVLLEEVGPPVFGVDVPDDLIDQAVARADCLASVARDAAVAAEVRDQQRDDGHQVELPDEAGDHGPASVRSTTAR